jgi:hypothetical protein
MLLAHAQGHESEAKVPRGCLLKRVNADPAAGDLLGDPLLMAGFRGDRASLWALEVCCLAHCDTSSPLHSSSVWKNGVNIVRIASLVQ